ncbi:MAG: LysR family transcriptional regulator [Deltaproteobacteria bacterium]|nr:LysR family transcriptional regulator [Deltaproteobacteria bacterium]
MGTPKTGHAAAMIVRNEVSLDDWDHIRFFLSAYRQRSFAGAARSMQVKSSTVSRRISALEELLGGALFSRTPDGLLPTHLAEEILHHAEGSERHFHGLTALADGHDSRPKGKVRVALTEAMANLLFLPALPALFAEYPELEIELLTGTQTADLSRREADIALRFVRPQESDLVTKRVARMTLSVLGHRDVVEKLPTHYSLQELQWITTQPEGLVSTPEAIWFEKNVSKSPVLVTNSYLTQLRAMQEKLGVACVVRCLLRGDSMLMEVPNPPQNMPVLDLWLVTHRALQRVPRVRAVWNILDEMGARLDDGWAR